MVVVNEDSGSAEVCVELDHSPHAPVQLSIYTLPGRAIG